MLLLTRAPKALGTAFNITIAKRDCAIVIGEAVHHYKLHNAAITKHLDILEKAEPRLALTLLAVKNPAPQVDQAALLL